MRDYNNQKASENGSRNPEDTTATAVSSPYSAAAAEYLNHKHKLTELNQPTAGDSGKHSGKTIR